MLSLCKSNEEELKTIIQERDQQKEEIEEFNNELNEKVRSMKTKNNQLREQRVEKRVLENLNNKIEEQIKTLGETIKSSILEEIQSSLTKVESKVDQVKTSYAAVTKVSTPVTTSGLKTIVKEARYEEMREKRDHDNRQNNVIIHGVSESAVEQNDAEDKKFVESLIKTIRIPTPNIKSILRIGASATDKRRPIKVILRSEKEKNELSAQPIRSQRK